MFSERCWPSLPSFTFGVAFLLVVLHHFAGRYFSHAEIRCKSLAIAKISDSYGLTLGPRRRNEQKGPSILERSTG
jgi:hypothetical protein